VRPGSFSWSVTALPRGRSPPTSSRWAWPTVERWEPDAVELVLADPPYGWQGWPGLLGRLHELGDVLVVVEAERPVEADGWEVVAHKRHGGTVVSQLRARGAIST